MQYATSTADPTASYVLIAEGFEGHDSDSERRLMDVFLADDDGEPIGKVMHFAFSAYRAANDYADQLARRHGLKVESE